MATAEQHAVCDGDHDINRITHLTVYYTDGESDFYPENTTKVEESVPEGKVGSSIRGDFYAECAMLFEFDHVYDIDHWN